MGLLTSIGNAAHRPSRIVYIGGKQVEPVSIDVELTIDGVSSQATIELASVPSSLNFRDNVRIDLGYDGFLSTVFTGEVEDDGRDYFPFTNTIKAVGPLHLAQFQYGTQVSYTSQTDLQIVTDLLNVRAGITRYDLDSDGTTLGTVQDVILRAGETPFSLINQIDQVFGYYTFDCPDGVVRRRLISGIPAGSPAFSYVQGDPSGAELRIFRVSRPRTIRGIHNEVIVTGLPQSGSTPSDTRQATNALVPTPPQYYAYTFDSDLIEGTAVAAAVSLRLMTEVNRVVEEIEVEAPGNPYLVPGITSIGLTSSQVGLSGQTPFFLKSVRHRFDERGFTSTMTLIGGVGDAGYEVSKPPEACFSILITKETWGGTTYYTTACDASCTTDPDTNQGSITYAWSNNENSDTGTALVYYTKFASTQFDTGTASITLVASDPDGNSGTITQTLDGTTNVIIARVTADVATSTSQFEATPDGGATFYTYAVSNARATPKIGAASAQHFGAGTTLYESDDYLQSTPTAIHSFSGTINDIWVNEVDANRITVGLDTGDVYVTTNSGDGTASTWTNLVTMPASVKRIVESFEQAGQYWTASSNAIWLTFDAFGAKAQHISFASTATARDIALSSFANYGCATGGGGSTDCVKREDGVSIVPTDGAADIYTITHHIRDDILYGAGVSGTNTIIYSKPAGGTTFIPVGTITGGGTPWTMIRDGDNPGVLYLAHDAALSKTYDGGSTWVTMRSGNGPYLQVGYGSAPLVPAVLPGNLWIGFSSVTSVAEAAAVVRTGANSYRSILKGTVPDGTSIGSAPGSSSTIYIAQESSLYRSTDSGVTWAARTVPTGGITAANGFAVDSSDPTILYVANSNGVYKSTDSGASWTQVYSTTACADIRETGGAVWALQSVVNGGVIVSTNGGTSWTQIDTSDDNAHAWFTGIPGDSDHAFGAMGGSGYREFSASGASSTVLTNLPSGTLVWLEENGATGTTLVLTQDPAIYRATSLTGTFGLVLPAGSFGLNFFSRGIKLVAFDPNTTTWYAVGSQDGAGSTGEIVVYISTDDGLTWSSETYTVPGYGSAPTVHWAWVVS